MRRKEREKKLTRHFILGENEQACVYLCTKALILDTLSSPPPRRFYRFRFLPCHLPYHRRRAVQRMFAGLLSPRVRPRSKRCSLTGGRASRCSKRARDRHGPRFTGAVVSIAYLLP